MKGLIPHSVVLALALSCDRAGAEELRRQLSVLMTVSGTCSVLSLADETRPCDGKLIHTEYDDGRVGFYFVGEGPEINVITFTGRGDAQEAPSKNVRIQPIDAVILKKGIVRVSGECLFENPYAGSARIWCSAKSLSNDDRYLGHFLTDGNEPSLLDVGEGNG